VRCYIWHSEEGPGRASAPPSPLLAVPSVTAHPSTASVPITVLLYDDPLLCGFNAAIKGLTVTQWIFFALSYARARLRRMCPSVCLSVCHKPVPCKDRGSHDHAVFRQRVALGLSFSRLLYTLGPMQRNRIARALNGEKRKCLSVNRYISEEIEDRHL